MAILVKNNGNVGAWRDLCSSVLVSLMLLNRPREGEASKLLVEHIDMICDGAPSEDIKASLSPFELKLCQHFKRVEIRGKRRRKVPMILTKKLEAAVKLIVNLRNAVGVNPENKYVFAIPTMNSIHYLRGNDAKRKHVRQIELQCPEAVTSTKLRKQIATLSQLLEERELEMLAGFLGYNIDVHREFYRLPEDTLQLAKCGKMLLLMDQGRLNEFAVKSLDEININLDGKYFFVEYIYFSISMVYLNIRSGVGYLRCCEVGSLIFSPIGPPLEDQDFAILDKMNLECIWNASGMHFLVEG